jgi:hypothetical protein
MKQSWKYFFFGALLLMAGLACNFGTDSAENEDPVLNDNSFDLNDTGDNSNDLLPVVSLTVTNGSERTACSIYVAPDESIEWGEERLGTEVLDPGESHAVEISDGVYRVRVNDCDGNLIAEYNDFEVDGATTLAVEEKSVDNTLVSAGEPGTLTVINNSSDDVCYVFVSPAGSTSWGNDWLGDSTILENGDQQTITVGSGVNDMQAADCDGNAIAEQYEIDFSTGQTWTLE